MLRGSDVFVLGGLVVNGDDWTYRSLAGDLGVPHPVVQRALRRGQASGLYSAKRREVHIPNFEEFAIHALRFLVPGQLGAVVPGVTAAWGAEPVAQAMRSSEDLPPVWPFARGEIRGQTLEPMHPAAVSATKGWSELGQLLAILDSLRAGDLRVRQVARRLLSETLRERAATPAR